MCVRALIPRLITGKAEDRHAGELLECVDSWIAETRDDHRIKPRAVCRGAGEGVEHAVRRDSHGSSRRNVLRPEWSRYRGQSGPLPNLSDRQSPDGLGDVD